MEKQKIKLTDTIMDVVELINKLNKKIEVMDGKELYEKYKGKEANGMGSKGVIVGHDDNDLIMAVTEGEDGWDAVSSDLIYEMENNPKGYWFVEESEIL